MRVITVLLLLTVCSPSFSKEGVFDPVLYAAYRERLHNRYWGAMSARRDRAISHQAALRTNFNPYNGVYRSVARTGLTEPLYSPTIIYVSSY